jgi:hypothetical protein
MHAPLAALMPCLVGAPSGPQALRAVVAGWRVDRFPPPGHRALGHRVLARRLPDRTLPPVILCHPATRDGRCRVAAMTSSLVHVTPVLVAVCGLWRRRHPSDPCGTRLARGVVRLPQNVWITQGGQGRAHPVWIVGGLRRKALQFWGDGW